MTWDEKKKIKDLMIGVEFLEAETSDLVMKDNLSPITIKSIHRTLHTMLVDYRKKEGRNNHA